MRESDTKQRRRYALEMISRLIEWQQAALEKEFSRTGRESLREQIQFLVDLREQYEGGLK